MFYRYTDPAKRAVFFARYVAMKSDAPQITSLDLLAGLMFEENSRAQVLFQLRDHFPLYAGCPYRSAEMPPTSGGPGLDKEARQIVMWTALCASRLGDFWIDTEHMLLGILHVRICQAASYLEMAGFTLESARKTVLENKSSRPEYGPVPLLWPVRAWLQRVF